MAPLPPRRPAAFASLAAAALAMPLPPARPAQLASLGGVGMANVATVTSLRRATALVPADADAKAQLRALFDAVSTNADATRPASRVAPIRLALARPHPDAPPAALIGALPESVTTRFGRRSPGDDLTAARFTGSATRAVPGSR